MNYMLKEIEKKYQVDNLEKLEQLLIAQGARFIKESRERDIYFNVSGRDSMTSKECLRIRTTPTKTELTYKPPTALDNTDTHFAKKETNLPIQNVETAIELLESLGNSLLVDLRKYRRYYELEGVTITLDMLNEKYSFVEIEVETADEADALVKIHHIANILNLSEDSIETRPYRDIAMGL